MRGYPDRQGPVRHTTPFTPVRRVEQEDQKGCFLACLAMAEGVEYKDIVKRLSEDDMHYVRQNGLTGLVMKDVLKKLGWIEYYNYRWIPGFTGGMSFYVIPWSFDRPAIFQIDSINFEGEQHLVYWDGRTLFDPSPLKQATLLEIGTKGVNNAFLISPWLREDLKKVREVP
jgi:hypothetical protein